MFFLAACITMIFMYGYIGYHLFLSKTRFAKGRSIFIGFVFFFASITFFPFLIRAYHLENSSADLISWFVYLELGLFSIAFVFFLMIDVLKIPYFIVKMIQSLIKTKNNPNEYLSNPSRRIFLIKSTNWGVMGLSTLLTGYGLYEARRKPAVKKMTISLKNLPFEFNNFKIVQITDIHISPTIKRDFVQMIVNQVNDLSPDLIAFTGDLVDGSVQHLKFDAKPLSELFAPYGVYFVTGNHEYYSNAVEWIQEAKRLGFTVLINEHRIIKRGNSALLIGGVTDHHGGRFFKEHAPNPKLAMQNAEPYDTSVLLAHQPKTIYKAAEAGFDLQLSGHTHGGQYYPWNFLVALNQPYVAGLHKYKNTKIYISKGTGYWGPQIRIGARSEITEIYLTQS